MNWTNYYYSHFYVVSVVTTAKKTYYTYFVFISEHDHVSSKEGAGFVLQAIIEHQTQIEDGCRAAAACVRCSQPRADLLLNYRAIYLKNQLKRSWSEMFYVRSTEESIHMETGQRSIVEERKSPPWAGAMVKRLADIVGANFPPPGSVGSQPLAGIPNPKQQRLEGEPA